MMSADTPPGTPPATSATSEAPAQTEAAGGKPINLIDPKLKARALKRLQGIVKGNGIKVEDVTLEDCDATVYPFQARTFVKLAPQYGVRIEPGLNKTAELLTGLEEFNRSLTTSVVQSRTEPPKRKAIIDFLFARPDKGFGMKDQKVSFHSLSRDFVMHEGCITCSKLGKVQCQKCHATGLITCTLCQSRKQITCPQCRGTGKTPGSQKPHSCIKCRGDGKILCTGCGGRGQIKCQTCAANGTLKCQKCAGTGWLSHLAHVQMEAQIHFDFEREVLPVEVHKMVDAFGSRLVEKNDIEVVLRKQPVTQQDINDEIALSNEPQDMIFIDYEAKVPFGPIRFRMKDRVIPATLFGYHGKLIEAPSFLDDITQKGQHVLREAANNSGNVAEKIRRAAKYRLLCDVILQAAGKAKQRQAIEILTNRYPTGMAADKMLNLFILADKALKNVTRKPRAIGLSVGLGLFAALMGAYLFMGGRSIAATSTGFPETGVSVIDGLFIPLGMMLSAFMAQAFSMAAQKQALAGLASQDTVRLMPKVGKTIWWALGGSLVIWAGLVLASIFLTPDLGPQWVRAFMAAR
jgi:hypothetical protein